MNGSMNRSSENGLDKLRRPHVWGTKLNGADLKALEACFIDEALAEAAGLRRVSDREGADIVGRTPTAHTSYAGIVFPYCMPGNYDRAREYRLRRDRPDLERKNGETKEKGKYRSPPGRST